MELGGIRQVGFEKLRNSYQTFEILLRRGLGFEISIKMGFDRAWRDGAFENIRASWDSCMTFRSRADP